MAAYDVLLIGHNELDFEDYYGILDNMASSGGRDHVAFTDMQLNHVKYRGAPYQGLDLMSALYNEGRPEAEHQRFYNGDCLWTAIAYLGSFLARRGYSFDFVNLFQDEREALKAKLKDNTYELIVLTGTMYVFEQNIWEVIRFIRRHAPQARVIAGGPYISKQAEEREPEYLKPLFHYLDADFYCYIREGEQTLCALLDALKAGTDVGAVDNLAYKVGNDYAITPKKRESNSLNDNMIDYALFADAYRPSGWANVRISDGCPYACGFCAFPEHGNERYMLMTLDRIERELDAIRDAGAITHIFFIDATLNVPRRQFKNMLKMMIRNQYNFSWHCFFRCDQTDEETVWLMKEAGCIGVFLGLESANATVLRNMDKTAHKEDFRRTMPWFKAAGLRTMISVQVGFPGETIASFHESLAFLEEIQPDFTRIQTWYCDPTTPVWFKRDTFGLVGKGYGWTHSTMDAETAVELVVHAFLALRGVSWVPDPGYNWTATYAMEKRGMSMERQKQYMALFAGAAKSKLLSRDAGENEPRVLEALRTCARFDVGAEPDMGAVDHLAPERYLAARAFWVDLCLDVPPAAAPEIDPDLDEAYNYDDEEDDEVGGMTGVEPSAGWMGVVGGTADPDDVLAAFRTTLAERLGAEGAILVGLDGDVTFPLRLGHRPGTGSGSPRAVARRLIAASREHHRFAWFVLTHPLTAKEFGVGCPPLRAAFVADGGSVADAALRRRWRDHAGVDARIDVALRVDGDRLELSSPTGAHDGAALGALGGRLLDVLGGTPAPLAAAAATATATATRE